MFHGRTVLCVGRNYANHAAELLNPLPVEPFFFLKPASSVVMVPPTGIVRIPPGVDVGVQHEVELAVEISTRASRLTLDNAMQHCLGYRVAVDVTARGWQEDAKRKSLPWARAKGFDTSCPVGPLIDRDVITKPQDIEIWLEVNGIERQRARVGQATFSIAQLLVHATKWMTLERGDLLLTGTPAGVGALQVGDFVQFGGIGPVLKFKCEEWR